MSLSVFSVNDFQLHRGSLVGNAEEESKCCSGGAYPRLPSCPVPPPHRAAWPAPHARLARPLARDATPWPAARLQPGRPRWSPPPTSSRGSGAHGPRTAARSASCSPQRSPSSAPEETPAAGARPSRVRAPAAAQARAGRAACLLLPSPPPGRFSSVAARPAALPWLAPAPRLPPAFCRGSEAGNCRPPGVLRTSTIFPEALCWPPVGLVAPMPPFYPLQSALTERPVPPRFVLSTAPPTRYRLRPETEVAAQPATASGLRSRLCAAS